MYVYIGICIHMHAYVHAYIYAGACLCTCVYVYMCMCACVYVYMDCSRASDGKESACNTGDQGSIPGWDDPVEKKMASHCSILAGRATVHRTAKRHD